MNEKDKLVLVYTGTEIAITRIESELEKEGIFSLKKDGFKDGIKAGFGGGVPSAIELYVLENDTAKTLEIIQSMDLK